MPRLIWLLAATGMVLAACEAATPLEAVSALCRDGSRYAGSRPAVESRCARRGGIASLTALSPDPKN